MVPGPEGLSALQVVNTATSCFVAAHSPSIPHLSASVREHRGASKLLCELGTEMQESNNNTIHIF